MLIDPPYEEREDFARALEAVEDALQRFESAVLVLWLPVKLRADFDTWLAQLRAAIARPVLASLLWMHPCDSRAALNGSALVLVNPPYLVEEGMREWLPELRALLGGPQSGCEVLASQRTAADALRPRARRASLPPRASTATLPAPAGSSTPR